MTVRFGLVGIGYGAAVLVPAIRRDVRARVEAIAASDVSRAQEAAAKHAIPQAVAGWRELLARADIDALAVAVPPATQPEIVEAALARGLPVFAEKPLASTLEGAQRIARAATELKLANGMDFNFTALAAFEEARRKLRDGTLGRISQVSIQWHIESYSNRKRLINWKTTAEAGGGTLYNFASHSLHYLEWLLGPVASLSAKLARAPDDPRSGDTAAVITYELENGASGHLSLNAAARAGSGHRIEVYGAEGALLLLNETADHMHGFKLFAPGQGVESLSEVALPDEEPTGDSRIAPTARLISNFIDWVSGGTAMEQDFAAGLRVQHLLEAARRSDRERKWIAVPRGT
jgi:predicted dehydrogenase